MSKLNQFGSSLQDLMNSKDDDPDFPDIQKKYIAIEDACWWIACSTFEEPGLGPYWLQGWLGDRSSITDEFTKNRGRYELAVEQLTASLIHHKQKVLGIVSESEVTAQGDEPDLSYWLRRSFLVEATHLSDSGIEREDGVIVVGDVAFDDLLLSENWLLSTFLPFSHGVGRHDPVIPQQSSPEMRSVETDASMVESRRGRRRKWDWDSIFTEIITLANTPDGIPDIQADLERWVANYCQSAYGHEPSASMIRQKVSPIYEKRRHKSR